MALYPRQPDIFLTNSDQSLDATIQWLDYIEYQINHLQGLMGVSALYFVEGSVALERGE